jgi:radical SAM-linked protein
MGDKLRLRFSKTGKAKYISHLDLTATMRRALLRAGVRLKYSEGFNPHPYMSAALPLSVGCGSVCELMDVGVAGGLLPDGLPAIITASLPEGIEVVDVYASERKFSSIAWIGIHGEFFYDKGISLGAAEMLAERFKVESIMISKKTKRGVSDIDIAPHIRDLEVHSNRKLAMTAKVSAQNPTINPENLLSALTGEHGSLKPDFALFTRTEIYDGELNIFR